MQLSSRSLCSRKCGDQGQVTIKDFLQLTGKNVLVSGASSGIGRAVAIEASRYGATVALMSRSSETMAETVAMMDGHSHECIPTDLNDLDGIEGAVRDAARALGGLDGVVHAAGIHSAVPVKNLRSDDVRRMLDVNVASAVLIAKAFRHKQTRRESGSLVLMSSAVGVVGQSGVSVYSATKGAILSLTKSLALELARDGIRVNCLSPGVVRTPMTESLRATIGDAGFSEVEKAHPLGLGEAEDVAAAALFLLSDASKWVTGTSLVVDGGYTAQ